MKTNFLRRLGLILLYLAFLSSFYMFLSAWGTINEFIACVLSGFTMPLSYGKTWPGVIAQRIFLFAAPFLVVPPFLFRVLPIVKRIELAWALLLLPITTSLLSFTVFAYCSRPEVRNYSIWANNKSEQTPIFFDTRPFWDFYTPNSGPEDETLQTWLIPMIRDHLGDSVQIRIRNTSSGAYGDYVVFAQNRYHAINGEDAEMPSVFLEIHRLGDHNRIILIGLQDIETYWQEVVQRYKSKESTP